MRKYPYHYILDSEKHPIAVEDGEKGLLVWSAWTESMENRRVAHTEINSSVEVSTVFLGIDHRFTGDGPPLLFETMIFGGPLDQHMWRYSSWDDALVGHEMAVKKAKAKAEAE